MYVATTLRSWKAMIDRFFEHTSKGSLDALQPLLDANLGKWEKMQVVQKAKKFEPEELVQFHEEVNTPQNLPQKAYSVISSAFTARGAEAVNVQFEDVKMYEDHAIVEYNHVKQVGTKSSERPSVHISGVVELKAIKEYIDCFQMIDRKGRFFRRLQYESKTSTKIVGTNANIGKNTCASFGKVVAARLNLPNPELYTGHTWRRYGIQRMVDSGMTETAIKAITGHSSSKSLQGYIDNSSLLKAQSASCMALKQKVPQEEDNTVAPRTKKAKASSDETDSGEGERKFGGGGGGVTVHINFSNATIAGAVSVVSKVSEQAPEYSQVTKK